MSFLRTAKLLTLRTGRSIGLFQALSRSQWRKNQLLILGYHGVSIDDEHVWNPGLYFTPEEFRSRMQALKDYGCNVLPLAEALEKLKTETLPKCSAVLTFDDGASDFYYRAFPILREFGWPSTVYLTSYYCAYNRPVFDTMCSYLLWKGSGRGLDVQGLIGGVSSFDLSTAEQRQQASLAIREYARREQFSAQKKDELLTEIAKRLAIDYDAILAKRILHLLSEDELAELVEQGVDIQLHTHRHYAPKVRDSFIHEMIENRDFISRFTKSPHHFAYPSGMYDDCFDPWLKDCEVVSAATCDAGMVTNQSDRYRLPRLVDTSAVPSIELEGWISGFANLLPRRSGEAIHQIPPYYY
jgi:peptidoglycan/xylan/chitin deacetylase (PgdA/CDA1 family)